MGLFEKVASVTIGALNNVVGKVAYKNTLHGLGSIVKSATPIILEGVVKDVIHSAAKDIDVTGVDELLRVKRTIAVLNELDQREPQVNLVPFELISLVNSISNEINKLLNEFGEDKVYVDELLLTYFINKFNVPKPYAKKVFEILSDNFCVENRSMRDAYNLFDTVCKFETYGGEILNDNINIANNPSIDTLFKEKIQNQSNDKGKKVRQFVR